MEFIVSERLDLLAQIDLLHLHSALMHFALFAFSRVPNAFHSGLALFYWLI